jgi:hypothetical protein
MTMVKCDGPAGRRSPWRRSARVAAVVAAMMLELGVAAAQAPPPSGAQVEVQIGLCATPDATIRALGLKSDGRPLDVWFVDDAALALYERGLRLRLRMKGERGALTLKVANQDCARVKDLVPPREGKCEYDRHGERVAGAVSLERDVDAKQAKRLVAGEVDVAKVLSPAQIRYLREVVGVWPLPADLRVLGPAALHRYRPASRAYDVDVWTLPNGGGHVEISRKVPYAEGDRAYRTLLEDLSRAGVAVCADQSARSKDTLRALLPPR